MGEQEEAAEKLMSDRNGVAARRTPVSGYSMGDLGYNPSMIKRVLYLLTIAFTLQLSWGVVSAYCMHETGVGSQHFGHHQHNHTSSNANDDAEKSPSLKKSVVHADCASCNYHGLGMVAWQHVPAPTSAVAAKNGAPNVVLPLPYLSLPERPQWQRAV